MGLVQQVSAVLFDFNGVLIDDEHLHFEGFNTVLAPYQIQMTETEYNERYLGFDDRGVFRTRFADKNKPLTDVELHGLIEQKARVYFELAQTNLRIFPEAQPVVKTIAHRVLVGIVSGALRDEIVHALGVMDVYDDVKFIVSAEDVRACKPDPEGYLAAIERLKDNGWNGHPNTVVAIEDSLAGIESAQKAGLQTIAVAHTYPLEQLRSLSPTVCVAELKEVLNVLMF